MQNSISFWKKTDQSAREEKRVDDLVLFEETSGCVDEQALEEVVLDVHKTLVQLLGLVRDVDGPEDWTFWKNNKILRLEMFDGLLASLTLIH